MILNPLNMKVLLAFVLAVYTAVAVPLNEVEVSEKRASSSFRNTILRRHNELRALHGASPLKWNSKVASFATSWCETLKKENGFRHSTSPYGENLGKSWKMPAASDETYATETVNNWYNEINSYDFNNPVFASSTGHFTQVVWKGSTELGCGISQDLSGDWAITWVCCNYSPPGNYMGKFADNVGRPKA